MSVDFSEPVAFLEQTSGRGSWALSAPASAAFALIAGGAAAVVVAPVASYLARGPLDAVIVACLDVACASVVALAVGRWRSARLREAPAAGLLLAASVWLPPLVLLGEARSLWSLPVAAAFGVLSASLFREMAFDPSESKPAAQKTFLLLPDLPPEARRRAHGAKVAAVTFYLGASAALFGDLGLAALLLALACAILAWFGLAGAPGRARSKIGLALAATVLALLPKDWIRLGPYQPPMPEGAGEGQPAPRRPGLFAGVVLLTDAKSEPPLIAPPAPRLPSMAPAKALEPSSIRFTGEYWYFFWPLRRPGEDAVRKLGDPITLTYRAVDDSSLIMQARQPLPQAIELSCCRAIDLILRNREKEPDTVYIELALLDSKGGATREQSLGGQRLVATPASSTRQATLRFDLPAAGEIRAFDEIVVWFHLDQSRRARSANLAIDRFDLIQ